ncbi:hypothetical protein H9Q10_07250 [Eikenella sp. S3360]|uniref:Uncharacterized protein n=2 Tax=Eikenella glucosivorans TaxID=2766967 RepID=A0ABS0NAZ3_9NEIS|nr:hypothetical protein [Eikenella glucosivorans]
MSAMKFIPLVERVYADLDNERLSRHIVGLTQTDSVCCFDGDMRTIKAGDYLYLYMDCGDDYCVSEGVVIANPYPTAHRYCCVLDEDILFWQDYCAATNR